MDEPDFEILGVRRYGEDDAIPIVIDSYRSCGRLTNHYRNGCIGIMLRCRGGEGLLHLTTEDALRLSDALRALAVAEPDRKEWL